VARSAFPLNRSQILDVLRCQLRDTLATLRGQSMMDFNPFSWQEEDEITAAPIQADSLELMTLAGHVNRLFALDETGLEDFLLSRRRLGDWVDVVSHAQDPNGGAGGTSGMRFMTSGSTGNPTEHAHHRFALEREARYLAQVFRGRKRLLCLAPRHHIYGFVFGVLLPRLLDVPLRVESDAERALQGKLQAGDLIVGFPLRWQYLQSTVRQFPDDVHGVTSTGPCEAKLIDSLKAKGLGRMTEVYGATDTAGIGLRHDSEADYRLFPWWQPDPDKEAKLLGQRHDGTLKASSLPDQLEWRDERHFTPMGRRDDVVQIGGVNVSPSHVARRLTSCPGVQAATVRLNTNGRLKAFIVPATLEYPDVESALREWIQANLPAVERPVEIRLGDSLPRSPLGKLMDWA